jgi:hypothetical protein
VERKTIQKLYFTIDEGGEEHWTTGACGIPVHREFHDHDFCNLLEEHRDGKDIDGRPVT